MAPSSAARRSPSGSLDGSGTRSVTATAFSGLVPQVTIGASAAPSSASSRSKAALGSDGRPRQWATALSHSAPEGAKGRPFR